MVSLWWPPRKGNLLAIPLNLWGEFPESTTLRLQSPEKIKREDFLFLLGATDTDVSVGYLKNVKLCPLSRSYPILFFQLY